jgi:O-antigen/teichoic acid export membrane protein
MKDLKQASARGAAWNLLQNLISRVLGLVVVAILSRLLDKNAFGGVALALAITSLAELLINGGYGEFITQTAKLDDEHLDTAFWFNAIGGGVLAGAIAASAGPLATAFGDADAAPVIQWTALSLAVRALGVVPAGLLVRELKFRTLSLRSVVASVIGGAAGIIAAFAGMGVFSLVIQLLVGDIAATAILWRATEWRPGRRLSKRALRDMSAFGTPLIAATLLGFVSRRLDAVIVAGAIGLASLGVYTLAQRVYQIALQVLNKSSVEVVFSALSRLAHTEDARRQAFLRVVELTAVLCFPAYIGLAVAAEPLTLTLFGPRWLEGSEALMYFALSGVPFSLTLIHQAALKSAGKTRAWLVINVILTIIYLPFMIVLVDYGPGPAAAASMASCALIIPFELWFLRTALGVQTAAYIHALRGPVLACALMTGATIGVERATSQLAPFVRLILVSGSGAVVYVLALRALAPTSFRRCRDLALQTLRRTPA